MSNPFLLEKPMSNSFDYVKSKYIQSNVKTYILNTTYIKILHKHIIDIMENFNQSVQGICLIKHLKFPTEIIKQIRYYVNFSVDLSGYTNQELVRFITDDHILRLELLRSLHRRQIIRYLYNKKIHVIPRKNRIHCLQNTCKLVWSSYKVSSDKKSIRLFDHKNEESRIKIWKSKNLITCSYMNRFSSVYIRRLFNYKAHIVGFIDVNNIRIFIDRHVFIWDLIFLYFHSNPISITHFYMKLSGNSEVEPRELFYDMITNDTHLKHSTKHIDLMNKYNIAPKKLSIIQLLNASIYTFFSEYVDWRIGFDNFAVYTVETLKRPF